MAKEGFISYIMLCYCTGGTQLLNNLASASYSTQNEKITWEPVRCFKIFSGQIVTKEVELPTIIKIKFVFVNNDYIINYPNHSI